VRANGVHEGAGQRQRDIGGRPGFVEQVGRCLHGDEFGAQGLVVRRRREGSAVVPDGALERVLPGQLPRRLPDRAVGDGTLSALFP
jgi:hypothetical protein